MMQQTWMFTLLFLCIVNSTIGFVLGKNSYNPKVQIASSSSRRSISSSTSSNTAEETYQTPFSPPKLIRGERYNSTNSTIPSPSLIASKLNIKPTKDATAKQWKMAWKMHKKLLPILHSTDSCKPPDSSLNLACMWWKALSGNDATSPVYDHGLAYDLLPSGWRRIIKLRRWFPRLHHANVELRTAYLDKSLQDIVSQVRQNNPENLKIQLVCMGAGYDLRGIKMLERKVVDQVFELDLPQVVEAKERLFQRLQRRRPWLNETMPTLIASDFNNVDNVKDILLENVLNDTTQGNSEWYTIFMFEGVMIYLNPMVPSSLLNVTSHVLNTKQMQGSLCFADRLENIPGGELEPAMIELERNGWTLIDWEPKPGLARHMGYASLNEISNKPCEE
jgi:hypothetical protein